MPFTVDALREKTRKKFAPLEMELKGGAKVELRSVLRLSQEDRNAVKAALSDINDLDIESDDTESLELVVERVSKVLNIVTDKPAKLLKELDDPDLMVKVSLLTDVLMLWVTETQLGEARNSPALSTSTASSSSPTSNTTTASTS